MTRTPPPWLKVPGIPYEVTTSGDYRVRRLIQYQRVAGHIRRIGGRELTPYADEGTVNISIPTDRGSIQRRRSMRALRDEALEAWANGLDPADPLPDSQGPPLRRAEGAPDEAAKVAPPAE